MDKIGKHIFCQFCNGNNGNAWNNNLKKKKTLLSPLILGEDVWCGGGYLHGVLGPLPHLLYPFLPLSSNHAEGVDLKCLPSGALILKDSKAQTLQKQIELSQF